MLADLVPARRNLTGMRRGELLDAAVSSHGLSRSGPPMQIRWPGGGRALRGCRPRPSQRGVGVRLNRCPAMRPAPGSVRGGVQWLPGYAAGAPICAPALRNYELTYCRPHAYTGVRPWFAGSTRRNPSQASCLPTMATLQAPFPSLEALSKVLPLPAGLCHHSLSSLRRDLGGDWWSASGATSASLQPSLVTTCGCRKL